MCVGFWVGVFLWAINNHTELFIFDYSPVTALLLGCFSSGTSYILNMVFGDSGIQFSQNIQAIKPKLIKEKQNA